MNIAPELLDILACPTDMSHLSEQDAYLHSAGGVAYPIIAGIPWLLPNPQNSLLDWRTKLNHFNQVLLSEIQTLEAELPRVTGATHTRLNALLIGKKAFMRRVSELLFPVVATKATNKDIYDALRDRAPHTQNLLSYEANLYRDWVWGEEENQLTSAMVLSKLPKVDTQKILVLGAGAGRLALDVHEHVGPRLSVATDINPLLVLAANHITGGNELCIHEFPLHPKSAEYVALEHKIEGVQKPDNFHFVFADAVKPCFVAHCFDVVITPWLVDIQPLSLTRFLKQLNQYLPVGGHWVNFGSLVFNQKRDALCYTVEEIEAIARDQGFELTDIESEEIPYLKSPYNAGHRQEQTWVWRARKIKHVEPLTNTQSLPAWLLDEKVAIPQQDYIAQFSKTHRIYAQLSAEVDGRTSLTKIAKKFARQNRFADEEAIQLVKNFFLDLYRQNH